MIGPTVVVTPPHRPGMTALPGTVTPAARMAESRGGPPDPQFKKVRNIPEKYRGTATSGLTAAVSADKAVHDFDIKP